VPNRHFWLGRIAQLVEQLTLNQRVQGSSPCAPTNPFNDLAEVALAIPTWRSAVIPTNRLHLFCLALSGEIAQMANLQHLSTVFENGSKTPQVAPPASTGNAGPQFESKVGAFYLLSLLAGSKPHGLPGAITRTVAFRQLAREVRCIPHRRTTRERHSQAAQLNIHRNRPCSVEANFKVHFASERKLRHDLGLDR
jgi:hypothetical protein